MNERKMKTKKWPGFFRARNILTVQEQLRPKISLKLHKVFMIRIYFQIARRLFSIHALALFFYLANIYNESEINRFVSNCFIKKQT